MDGIWDGYVRLFETLNLLTEERESRGSMIKEFLQKKKKTKFFGMLEALKMMFSSLTALRKIVQTKDINLLSIIRNIFKMKTTSATVNDKTMK